MSLLTIAQAIAPELSIAAPATVLTNTSDDAVKLVQFTVAAANEITRRVDWGALRSTATLTGTGASGLLALPAGVSRLIEGAAIKVNSGDVVRAGLSPDEWNALPTLSGTPRYAYLTGTSIGFYPFLASGATATVTYHSSHWCASGATWGSDSEAALIPELLIQQGTIWRWRRHLGQDYQDYLAEFEATLAELSKFDGGIRSP